MVWTSFLSFFGIISFYFECLQYEDVALHVFCLYVHVYVFVCLPGLYKAIQFEFTCFNIEWNCLIEAIEQITPIDTTCHLPPHLPTQPRESVAMWCSTSRPHRPDSSLCCRCRPTQLQQNSALGRTGRCWSPSRNRVKVALASLWSAVVAFVVMLGAWGEGERGYVFR